MADQSAIAWCDSTFNPWMGCTKVSPACDHCYAERLVTTRLKHDAWGPGAQRVRTAESTWKAPRRWAKRPFFECPNCAWRGDQKAINRARNVRQADVEKAGVCPYCGTDMMPARRRVFCASLADVFDNEVPWQWRADLLQLIDLTPEIDWLLLTKRIGNVEPMLSRLMPEASWLDELTNPVGNAEPMLRGPLRAGVTTVLDLWPRPNVWLGITVCNQAEADRDIPKLLRAPAKVRFVSIEPMLGPVNNIRAKLAKLYRDSTGPARGIDWVICGGESGPDARPMHPDWPRAMRDQCAIAGVPFFFKQWGEWAPRGPESMGYPLVNDVPRVRLTDRGHNGQDLAARGGNDVWMQRSGVKANGTLLDGVEHQAWPASRLGECV